MPNFFYFDRTNQKQCPVNAEQLKELATRGGIDPNTPMETDGGHKGTAGQIPGLFTNVPIPAAQTVQAPPSSAVNLFCTNCGAAVSEHAVACMSCGAKPVGHKKFCRHCGVALNPEQVV
jgi:ribosomal protein L40E